MFFPYSLATCVCMEMQQVVCSPCTQTLVFVPRLIPTISYPSCSLLYLPRLFVQSSLFLIALCLINTPSGALKVNVPMFTCFLRLERKSRSVNFPSISLLAILSQKRGFYFFGLVIEHFGLESLSQVSTTDKTSYDRCYT